MLRCAALSEAAKITVVLPTYNRAGLLPDAIRSVLGQTRGDFELLVVDDASTDDTAAVVEGFARLDARVRLLRQPENRGISAALNRALAEARGEFVGRVDSDDAWLPEFLEATSAVLEANATAGVAYAIGEAMDRQGRPLPALLHARRGGPMPRPDDALGSLLLGDFTCNIAILARRPCFTRAGGYDETLVANEDWDVWLRIARDTRFVFVDRVLARYRLHAGNITDPGSARFVEVAESRLRVLDKAFADPALPTEARSLETAAYRNAYLAAGRRLLHAGHARRGASHLQRAFEIGGRNAAAAAAVARAALDPMALARAAAGRYFRA